ncbi:hypothetical protein SHIRM173S_05069 [Streptomyces hirsutus]
MTGARPPATAEGLDRFWHDIRTRPEHDPVAYKRREVGHWFLQRRTARTHLVRLAATGHPGVAARPAAAGRRTAPYPGPPINLTVPA